MRKTRNRMRIYPIYPIYLIYPIYPVLRETENLDF